MLQQVRQSFAGGQFACGVVANGQALRELDVKGGVSFQTGPDLHNRNNRYFLEHKDTTTRHMRVQ